MSTDDLTGRLAARTAQLDALRTRIDDDDHLTPAEQDRLRAEAATLAGEIRGLAAALSRTARAARGEAL